jgi:phosphatidylglycerophosphatase A
MRAARVLVTVFGLGRLRPAPGTWGSLPPPALVLILVWAAGPHWTVDACLALLALLGSVACVRFGGLAESWFGRTDPSEVVADETAGQSLALLLLPWQGFGPGAAPWHDPALCAIAFVSFRILDILKPPPARQAQALPAGWGILADDLIAGAMAALVTQVAARFLL